MEEERGQNEIAIKVIHLLDRNCYARSKDFSLLLEQLWKGALISASQKPSLLVSNFN